MNSVHSICLASGDGVVAVYTCVSLDQIVNCPIKDKIVTNAGPQVASQLICVSYVFLILVDQLTCRTLLSQAKEPTILLCELNQCIDLMLTRHHFCVEILGCV